MNTIYRKTIAMLLAGIMIFAFAACGKTVEEPSAPVSEPVSEAPEATEDPSIDNSSIDNSPITAELSAEQSSSSQPEKFIKATCRYDNVTYKLMIMAKGYDTYTWMIRLKDGSSVKLADYSNKNVVICTENPETYDLNKSYVFDRGATLTVYHYEKFPADVTIYLLEAEEGECNGFKRTDSTRNVQMQPMVVTDTTSVEYVDPITVDPENPGDFETGSNPGSSTGSEGNNGGGSTGGEEDENEGAPTGEGGYPQPSYEEMLKIAAEHQANCQHRWVRSGAGGVTCFKCNYALGTMTLEQWYEFIGKTPASTPAPTAEPSAEPSAPETQPETSEEG